jgi:3'(2'), 5'-bisphosphate nucleotidase
MTMMPHAILGAEELAETLAVAEHAARLAGDAALRFYGSVTVNRKQGDSPVTQADHASNDVILRVLADEFPGDALLSEESEDPRDRLTRERVWIIDPLDGTKEFIACNGEFSVMIGLAIRGVPVLGVVFKPDGDVLYSASSGGGAWATDRGGRRRLEAVALGSRGLRMVGSRSHADPLVERIRSELRVDEVRPSGSVGIKCSLIAEGECDLYVHPVPYLREWDTCAPEILLREAGGTVVDCLGSPLVYNKESTFQPAGIVATGRLTDVEILDRIGDMYRASLARE